MADVSGVSALPSPMSPDVARLFRRLPAVDRVLVLLEPEPELSKVPRPLLRELVNRALDRVREGIRSRAVVAADLEPDALFARLSREVRRAARPHFRRVLNATGVVVHTNLGRSLLAVEAAAAVVEACRHYSNLEFDLETGHRGSRYSHVAGLLTDLTGAESAVVVNNNAAAVLLVLESLAHGREVIVSRGQLVEIGGSFRIPEVMTKSGAILREVGATNRTHLRDYAEAITDQTAALLRVHCSNYRIIGFTKEVALSELAALGRERGVPVLEDLGSGNFFRFEEAGLPGEPTVQEVVAGGADVVTFSGDKVLGGPQAGIIVGRRELLARIQKNPLNRAVRIDKMTLAALEATLRLYHDPARALASIPTLRMITLRPAVLKTRAGRLARLLRGRLAGLAEVATRDDASRVGGGAFPERDLPTTIVCVRPLRGGAEALKYALLDVDPPLAGRLEEDEFCLDPRTLDPSEFSLAAEALCSALRGC